MTWGFLWYWILTGMLAVYAALDGFDLGAGVLHPVLGKNEKERETIVRSLGPVWDGNEVWLLAAGGTLVLAFPKVYAASFSGFYLPLIMVLWLLAFRALAIELRHHVEHPVWKPFWDVALGVSSALLAVFLGAALGNVVRGVDFAADGSFFMPLFTDFDLDGPLGILDWYTVLAGLTALTVLVRHGALWLAMKTSDQLRTRARQTAQRLILPTAVLYLLLSFATFSIQPAVREVFTRHPLAWVLPALVVLGLVVSHRASLKDRGSVAFLASAMTIVAMLFSAALGLFPNLLPATSEGASLTVYNAASPERVLSGSLWWFIPGMALCIGYFVFLYSRLPARFDEN